MSIRSRREHKPTTKYLNYYSEVCVTPNSGNKRHYNISGDNKHNVSSTVNSNPISSLIKKRPRKICGRRKLTTDKVEVLCEESPVSMRKNFSSSEETSPEIRRSGRKHKPNLKLKEYVQPPCCNIKSSCSALPTTPKKRNRKSDEKGYSASSDSCSSSSPKKNKNYSKNQKDIPIEPYFDGFEDNDESRSRKFSIGLVDCFEGLTKELAETYPVTSVETDTSLNDKSNEPLKQNDSSSESLKDDSHNTKRGIKRNFNDTYERDFSKLSKHKRFKPSTVRNLTKTRKSTRVTTVVETVDLRNNKRRKMMIKNQKLKVTKQYPVKESLHTTDCNIKEKDTNSSPGTPSNQNIGVVNSSKSSSLTQKYFKKQEVENQGKDIKETLKKFLIMGTKVANAISETLKHNEEALLSKSSAFERKCLSLVHALAQQGSDLEEDDMEKVLKLLDEEQEERRAYRHTFLESLRVSHLTNMALYSQMLRLLKTL